MRYVMLNANDPLLAGDQYADKNAVASDNQPPMWRDIGPTSVGILTSRWPDHLFRRPCRDPIIVRLNAEHSAIVTAGRVAVGCQHFSFGAVEDLYRAVQAIKENKV
jgi:hypothetical protein